jgi:hypothetical protein
MSPEKRAAAHSDGPWFPAWMREPQLSKIAQPQLMKQFPSPDFASLERIPIDWRYAGAALEGDSNLILWHRGNCAHLGNLLRGSEIGPGLG